MELFENKVGRPSNETLKKRRLFKVGVVIGVIVLMLGAFCLGGYYGTLKLKGAVSTITISNSPRAGDKVTLSSTPIYSSAYSTNKSSTKSGDYYLYDGKVIQNKMRIVKNKSDVGKGYTKVIGWIKVTKKTVATNTTKALSKVSLKCSKTTITTGETLVCQTAAGAKASVKYSGNSPYSIKYNPTVNSNGGFTQKLTTAGSYKVTATKSGYSDNSITITVKSKTTKATTKTTKLTYKANEKVKLSNTKIYYSATGKTRKTTKSGTYYIYKTATTSNGRIRISESKNGSSYGWVDTKSISKVTTTTKATQTTTKVAAQTTLKSFTLSCPTQVYVGNEGKCTTNTTGVKISLTTTNLHSDYKSSLTTTSSDKTKVFKYTKAGTITVKATKSGYKTITKTVTIKANPTSKDGITTVVSQSFIDNLSKVDLSSYYGGSKWIQTNYTGYKVGTGYTESSSDIKYDTKNKWYTYNGSIVVATATTNLGKRGETKKIYYFTYKTNNTLYLKINGKWYKAIVLDSCGACTNVTSYGQSSQVVDIWTKSGSGFKDFGKIQVVIPK